MKIESYFYVHAVTELDYKRTEKILLCYSLIILYPFYVYFCLKKMGVIIYFTSATLRSIGNFN